MFDSIVKPLVNPIVWLLIRALQQLAATTLVAAHEWSQTGSVSPSTASLLTDALFGRIWLLALGIAVAVKLVTVLVLPVTVVLGPIAGILGTLIATAMLAAAGTGSSLVSSLIGGFTSIPASGVFVEAIGRGSYNVVDPVTSSSKPGNPIGPNCNAVFGALAACIAFGGMWAVFFLLAESDISGQLSGLAAFALAITGLLFAFGSILADRADFVGQVSQALGVTATVVSGLARLLGFLAFRGLEPSARLYNGIAVAAAAAGFGLGILQIQTCG